MKKWKQIACILMLLAGMFFSQKHFAENGGRELKKTEEAGNLQETGTGSRQKTVIVYDNVYKRAVSGKKEAKQAIAQEAASQRNMYENPGIRELEARMEEEYGIFQVTLGEMEQEMAEKVESAFSYMYKNYPVLQEKLTNVTLGNIETDSVALTRYRDFILPEKGIYPMVMKHEIVLNARDFLNKNRMDNLIRKSVSQNHWMEGMNIEALVVHELGHVLVNEIRMERYGLRDFYYITEENQEAFAFYNTDILAANQTTARELLERAYDIYEGKEQMSFEEACESISGYAKGIQPDGGISFEETCAEAVTDLYLNQESANGFSICILKEMESFLE